MKNIFTLFIIFFIMFLSGIIYSQSGWIQINPGYSHNYKSVHFIDSLNGLACGSGGAIVKTTNGGANWINITGVTSLNLNDIKFFSPTVAIAVGDYQLIVRSTNGGLNWNVINPQASQDYSIENLNLSGQNNAIAHSISYIYPYGYYYHLYKTTDMGATWQIQQVYFSADWIEWMHFINLNTGWANGSYSTGPPFNQYYLRVFKTTNGGSNWVIANQSDGTSINPGRIYFYDNNLGFKYSNIGTIMYFNRSLDGGFSWGSGGVSLNRVINCFYFVDSQTGWMVGANSLLYKTNNSGTNWTEQVPPILNNLNRVYFMNSQTGWIAATSSGLLKTTTGGIYTSANILSKEIPKQYGLAQNYPNPFNPITKINFTIPLSRGVSEGRGVLTRLIVYDILGREVTTLVNEQLQPGTYEVDWDGSKYTSGVYFCKLVTADYSETKKMVLVK